MAIFNHEKGKEEVIYVSEIHLYYGLITNEYIVALVNRQLYTPVNGSPRNRNSTKKVTIMRRQRDYVNLPNPTHLTFWNFFLQIFSM